MSSQTDQVDHKLWLIQEIEGKASWCGHVATLFPNDRRSHTCSDTLNHLAAAVQALPDSHPLFNKLKQISQVDSVTRERWLDELRLEFSNIGWLSPASSQQAIRQLMGITDASLRECWKAQKLH